MRRCGALTSEHETFIGTVLFVSFWGNATRELVLVLVVDRSGEESQFTTFFGT